MSQSKTKRALEYLNTHPSSTKYHAAKLMGVSPSAVYRALKNLEETKEQRCEHCGSLIRE